MLRLLDRIGRWLGLAATLVALTAASLALTATPAAAHDYDGYSRIYCEAHKSGSEQTIIHTWPYSLEPGYLNYVCTQDFYGVRHQFFVRRNMTTGAHSLASGYQKCAPYGYIVCEAHG